jgi:hypothetical protein
MEELFDLVREEIKQGKMKMKTPPPGGGGHGKGPSQEYADGWNAVMAKFDDPNISDQELQDLIAQISSGKLTSI